MEVALAVRSLMEASGIRSLEVAEYHNLGVASGSLEVASGSLEVASGSLGVVAFRNPEEEASRSLVEEACQEAFQSPFAAQN